MEGVKKLEGLLRSDLRIESDSENAVPPQVSGTYSVKFSSVIKSEKGGGGH